VDQTKEVNRVTPHIIVDVEWKRLYPPTRKAVWPDVVSAAPTNNLTRLSRNALVESASQSFGNLSVLCFLARQVIAEPSAENRLHNELPKTS
jgi:hypothetical protein